MIGNLYSLTSRDGIVVILNDRTDPSNFIALQEYPQFDVDVKNSEVQKEGQHGIWDFSSFYGKRTIQFAGVIVGTTEANIETLKRKLLQVTALPAQPDSTRDGFVTIKWTDASSLSWQIDAKLERAIHWDRQMKWTRRLNFFLSLKAPNPTIESQTIQTFSGLRGWQIGALKLTTLLPALFGPSYGNGLVVTNAGSASAYTTIRLYGESTPVTNPRIKNGTTGRTFRVLTTLNSPSEYIEINSKTATVVDQNGNDKSGLVDASSSYINLIPGANTLCYMSDESDGLTNPILTGIIPTGVFTISYRDSVL